jgi:hypothetical protein
MEEEGRGEGKGEGEGDAKGRRASEEEERNLSDDQEVTTQAGRVSTKRRHRRSLLQSFGRETEKERWARKASLAAEDERTSVTWRTAWCEAERAQGAPIAAAFNGQQIIIKLRKKKLRKINKICK